MLGQDLQRHVLVNDLPNQRAECLQLVDMPRIHQHRIGQGALLPATGLVRLVKQRTHLGVLAEHQFIEMPRQRFATRFQQRDGGFNQGGLLRGQHAGFLIGATHCTCAVVRFISP